MAELYKRPGSPFWYAYLRDPRQPDGLLRRSTKCRVKGPAREVAAALQAEVDRELEALAPASGLRWSEAAEIYLGSGKLKPSTATNYASMTNVIARSCLGDFDVGSLTPPRIKEYVQDRRKTSVRMHNKEGVEERLTSDATIRRHLSFMSVTIDYLIEHEIEGAPPANPFRQFDRKFLGNSKIVDKHMRPNQFQEVLDSLLTDEHRYILITLVGTGMRTGELCNLYWGEVDLENRLLEFGNIDPDRTKTSRSRRIPMLDPVRDVLTAQMRAHKRARIYGPNQLVFPSTVTAGPRPNFSYLIKVGRKRTTQKTFTIHGLRHTFASWCLQKGLDPIALRDVLGHTTLSTSMRYARHVTDSVADRVRGLNFPLTAQNTAQSIGLEDEA